MIDRLALALASVAAVLTLALALGLAGLTPAPVPAHRRVHGDHGGGRRGPAATNDPNVQVDTIYVEAPPAPLVVTSTDCKTGVDDEHESGGDD